MPPPPPSPGNVCHGGDSFVDVVLLRVLDDVFSSGPLVAEDAAVAVVAGQVHVYHLGVVANANLNIDYQSLVP